MSSSSFTKKPFQEQNGQMKMGMSLAMRQALQVLQMPIEELNNWLNLAITENPFLEWNEKRSFEEKKTPYHHCLDHIPNTPSLFSHLIEQAHQNFASSHLFQIAEWIIGNIEPTGFFLEPFSKIPFPCSENDFLLCLEKVKEFDPPGIGAKDTQESLLLQLKALEKETSLTFQIIQDDLESLLAKKFSFLQKKYSLSEEALEKILFQDIASLDPFPGYRFKPSESSFLPVDVIFLPEETSQPIEVIEPTLPLQKTICLDNLSKEEKNLCKALQTGAYQVITAVKKRSFTLLRVTKHLVKKQKEYLEGNIDTLEPLSIQMIAEELNLHESTVTRTLADKNLACPRGVIPLKSLLSKELSEDISSDKAQKLLKKLIAEENKQAPLSDRELLEKLKQFGVPCARRTLTKYRTVLKIPCKKMRKIYF